MILSKTQTHARQNRQSFHTNNMQWTKMPSLLGLINPPCLYTQQTSHSFTEKAVGCADGCWDKETKHHVDTRTSQWTCSFWVSRCRKSKVVGILLVEILFKSHQSGFKPFFFCSWFMVKKSEVKTVSTWKWQSDSAVFIHEIPTTNTKTQIYTKIQEYFKNIYKICQYFIVKGVTKDESLWKVYDGTWISLCHLLYLQAKET